MVRPNADDLATAMGKSCWLLLLRGLVAIAFALLTWLQPAASLAAMVLVFGIYVLADGVLGIWAALSGRMRRKLFTLGAHSGEICGIYRTRPAI